MTSKEEVIDLILKSFIELVLDPEKKITKNLEKKLDIVIERIESLEEKIEKKRNNSSEEEKGAFSWF